jgi:hypothetical protein
VEIKKANCNHGGACTPGKQNLIATSQRAGKYIDGMPTSILYPLCNFAEKAEFCSVANKSVAATMTNVPKIGSSSGKKRKSNTTGSRKKNGKSGSNDIASAGINLLTRMERNWSLEDQKIQIVLLRQQITQEETNRLNT